MTLQSDLFTRAKNKERAALARLLSWIENRDVKADAVLAELYKTAHESVVIGITGPPGAGKSTLTNSLVSELRKSGKTLAVLAVDPSSPFTGGAILGDRIRMQDHIADPGVFIRSIGTRGQTGGLSASTRDAVRVFEGVGFDCVIVETAGVGQTELEILKVASTVVLVLVPESGDGIQIMKAGVIEIADVFVINKCDRPGAEKLVRELHGLASIGAEVAGGSAAWDPPVTLAEATVGKGVSEVLGHVIRHVDYLKSSGLWAERRSEGLRTELRERMQRVLSQKLDQYFETTDGVGEWRRLGQKTLSIPELVATLNLEIVKKPLV